MKERRKRLRQRLAFPAVALDSSSGKVLGHIANITTEGVMLKTETAVDIDCVFDLQIPLPDEILGRVKLRIQAHSLWCQRATEQSHFATGLALLNLTESDTRIIELLIQDAVYQRMIS